MKMYLVKFYSSYLGYKAGEYHKINEDTMFELIQAVYNDKVKLEIYRFKLLCDLS